jgi:hypothetical protein
VSVTTQVCSARSKKRASHFCSLLLATDGHACVHETCHATRHAPSPDNALGALPHSPQHAKMRFHTCNSLIITCSISFLEVDRVRVLL